MAKFIDFTELKLFRFYVTNPDSSNPGTVITERLNDTNNDS